MKVGTDRKYTPEFRGAAIKQVIEGRRSMPSVARSLAMLPKTLANWVYRARRGQALLEPKTRFVFLRTVANACSIKSMLLRLPPDITHQSAMCEIRPFDCLVGLNGRNSPNRVFGSNSHFGTQCSSLPHSHARLASGWWLAFAGRVSNPLDPRKRFRSFTSEYPLIPDLTWRDGT